MKLFYSSLLLLLLITTTTFAQGISVQGIARDAKKAAIGNKMLSFTFDLQTDAGASKYKETEEITTDAFGVFSHIIGTGSAQGIAFNEVDYSTDHLKLIISLNGEVISDQPFNYTPYAYHANNGAPTGSIIPYVGATAPKGWLLCNGEAIPNPTTSGKALKALLNDNNTPNLQGTFLRGTGRSPVSGTHNGPALNQFQGDDNKSHAHSASLSGSTTSTGGHNHITKFRSQRGGTPNGSTGKLNYNAESGVDGSFSEETDSDGRHNHNISVSGSTRASGTESRPVNYGVNYIIKL